MIRLLEEMIPLRQLGEVGLLHDDLQLEEQHEVEVQLQEEPQLLKKDHM